MILYQQACEKIHIEQIDDYVIRRTRLSKSIMDILVSDAIETSRKKLTGEKIKTLEDVLRHPHTLIDFSEAADNALRQLEQFLMQNMYLHPNLKETAEKVRNWLSTLFADLCQHPKKMPHYYQKMIATEGLYRTVCDYLSGMTDRFCLNFIDETQ